MKQACADFIEKCSYAHLPIHCQPIINDWFNVLDECLSHEVQTIRAKAISALPALFNEYFKIEIIVETQPTIPEILKKYVKNLHSDSETVRMGYASALGVLPSFMIQNTVLELINALIDCSKIKPNSLKWAQSRRDAIKALTEICKSVKLDYYSTNLENIYECFFVGLSDYTQDTRGDIGAWVREAAMTGLQVLTILLEGTGLLTPSLVEKTVRGVVQQAVERIDRTRALAGVVFSTLLHHKPEIPYFPNRDSVVKIFPEELCSSMNWNSAASTFPLFTELLAFHSYSYDVLLGLIISVGGLTEGLVSINTRWTDFSRIILFSLSSRGGRSLVSHTRLFSTSTPILRSTLGVSSRLERPGVEPMSLKREF